MCLFESFAYFFIWVTCLYIVPSLTFLNPNFCHSVAGQAFRKVDSKDPVAHVPLEAGSAAS